MNITVLGIYGSPRKRGNTDRLLDRTLEGAESQGTTISRVYARKLDISGCIECGGCDETGRCVVQDEMQEVYPLLDAAGIVFLAAPVFFYNVPAQVKALIDRTQACWARRRLEAQSDSRNQPFHGTGYLISAAASHGKRIFEGCELTARYFFDALAMEYQPGLLLRGLETPKDLAARPQDLSEAFELGRRALATFQVHHKE